MPKIPLYFFKPLEELGRAVAVAVLAYAATAIYVGGVPDSGEAWRALATGALPIAIAALRAAMYKTPMTPDGEAVDLPGIIIPTSTTRTTPPSQSP